MKSVNIINKTYFNKQVRFHRYNNTTDEVFNMLIFYNFCFESRNNEFSVMIFSRDDK